MFSVCISKKAFLRAMARVQTAKNMKTDNTQVVTLKSNYMQPIQRETTPKKLPDQIYPPLESP